MQATTSNLRQIACAPDYFISTDGHVFSSLSPGGGPSFSLRPVTIGTLPSGHKRVQLTVDGKVRHLLLHRLLMLTFGPPRPAGRPHVRHLDGNPANNDLRNLAWGTQKDNMADEIRLGKTRRGTQQVAAKLTADDVLTIRAAHAAGESTYSISDRYPVSQSTIYKIVKRYKWAWLHPDCGRAVSDASLNPS